MSVELTTCHFLKYVLPYCMKSATAGISADYVQPVQTRICYAVACTFSGSRRSQHISGDDSELQDRQLPVLVVNNINYFICVHVFNTNLIRENQSLTVPSVLVHSLFCLKLLHPIFTLMIIMSKILIK